MCFLSPAIWSFCPEKSDCSMVKGPKQYVLQLCVSTDYNINARTWDLTKILLIIRYPSNKYFKDIEDFLRDGRNLFYINKILCSFWKLRFIIHTTKQLSLMWFLCCFSITVNELHSHSQNRINFWRYNYTVVFNICLKVFLSGFILLNSPLLFAFLLHFFRPDNFLGSILCKYL